MTALRRDTDRLLDNLTETNRDFVDEKLAGIRQRLRDLEGRKQELETVADGPLDVEAATAQALAQMARFRHVLDQGAPSTREKISCAEWWPE